MSGNWTASGDSLSRSISNDVRRDDVPGKKRVTRRLNIGATGAVRALAFHALAVALVFLFVNLFHVWRALGAAFGLAIRDALPWIVIVGMAAVVGLLLSLRRWRTRVSWPWLAASVAACATGLVITNPAYPAERIHMPEYFLLACVVWLSIPASRRTSATPFLLLACAALYGIHDEFLQGLSSSRTFDPRDRFVNLCGAAGGIFAIVSFAGQRSLEARDMGVGAFAAVASALIGTALFAWTAGGYRNDILPFWTLLPVLAGAFWTVLASAHIAAPGDRTAAHAFAAVCIAFLFYPVLIYVTHLDFV